MKRIGLMFIAVCMTAVMFAETIPANDSRITYIGRTMVENNAVSFDWTATMIRVSFEGKSLQLKASDTHKNYFNVWIDRPMTEEPNRVIATCGTDTVITLVQAQDVKASKRKVHDVVIQKRTEGEQGTTTFSEFTADGTFYAAEPLHERQLEFIGDSYTCGYGSENSVRTDHFTAETENAGKAYAAIVSRYFGADYVSIAHSGMGIARNYNTKFKGWYMVDRYLQTFDMDSTLKTRWNAQQSAFHPAMTIVYLGANDFSVSMQPKYETFRDLYVRLLNEIKANYGQDHPVLCVTCKAHEYLYEYVREMAKYCGLSNVYYLGYAPMQHHDNNTDLGADFHPNYAAHQKIAYSLIPYIATITGWELQDSPVK